MTPLLIAAGTLRIDAVTAEVSRALAASGVQNILLKGPSISAWLYADGTPRPYGDTDLLVDLDAWAPAQQVLRDLGFVQTQAEFEHPRMRSYASDPWRRGGSDVDLHATLHGFGVSPAVAWRYLSRDTDVLRLGGVEVSTLAAPARAMHIAMHAAHHGLHTEQTLEDLRRAVAQLDDEVWTQAADLAADLQATEAMAAGLRLLPEGLVVATRLGIEDAASVESALKTSPVATAQGFGELATTPGLAAKLGIIRRELAPTPSFMRWWSPLARRGPRGLAAAYVWRLLYLTVQAPGGMRAWREASRQAHDWEAQRIRRHPPKA